jgi:phosphoenolpyruvate synthase/pyruvate phosphate dikinase
MSLYTESVTQSKAQKSAEMNSIINERLTKIFFDQLSGILGSVPFVKFVVDRTNNNTIHFINDKLYHLHAYYVCDQILKEPQAQFFKSIDAFNEETYHSPNRRFYFGTLGRIRHENKQVYTLETQEIDSMNQVLIEDLYAIVKSNIDTNFELYFKPANHLQEKAVENIPSTKIPRIYTSEIYANSTFISLTPGSSEGRLRVFHSDTEFHAALNSIEWYDIIVMHRVPDDVPRVSGMINADFTTPLSHTNVLAAGWKIPNCIQRDIFETIYKEHLDRKWVRLEVAANAVKAELKLIEEPKELKKPNWVIQKITIETPDVEDPKIRSLEDLRMSDRYKYGTKAANIGEMKHVLKHGSNRILGFYQVNRPPRENLIPHIANFLGKPESEELMHDASNFLASFLKVPRGIALPFSIQRRFLETSPQIQQAIGKLKMALELDAHEIDSLCVSLQKQILKTRMPDSIRDEIDRMIIKELSGVSTFVLRSSSNAEDLENFSAAGIYESVNHLTSAEKIFEGVKQVWASLVSARSVRLRQQSGISLDDSYMGVIIQEEVESGMGGVMVTKNPMDKNDFRNVYINVSLKSVIDIVQGAELPMQYLYNSVEGGGTTLSLGGAKEDLSTERLDILKKMAFAGRLMQSHFSPDYTFSHPADIEWLANRDGVYFLQLRPSAKLN